MSPEPPRRMPRLAGGLLAGCALLLATGLPLSSAVVPPLPGPTLGSSSRAPLVMPAAQDVHGRWTGEAPDGTPIAIDVQVDGTQVAGTARLGRIGRAPFTGPLLRTRHAGPLFVFSFRPNRCSEARTHGELRLLTPALAELHVYVSDGERFSVRLTRVG